LANIFAVFLQPAVAAFADKSKRIQLKSIAVVFTAAAGMLASARLFMPGTTQIIAVLFVLELTALLTLQPLINSLGMQLINKGRNINFSLARGVGSIAFAIFAVLLGNLVEQFGTDFLSLFSIIFYVGFAIAILAFMNNQTNTSTENQTSRMKMDNVQDKTSASLLSFMKQNKKFVLLMVAVAFTFCSHSLINYYMIQITQHVGGTAKELGIATGIAAAIELPAMILFNPAIKRFRCSSILIVSLFFFVIKTAITFMAENMLMLYIAQLFECCSYALFIPASIYYVNRILKKEDLVKGQAFITSAITLGSVVASILGGRLLDGFGVKIMLLAGLIVSILGLFIGLCSTEKLEVNDLETVS
jgi:PPP family 3-phenylpropionic acid transporter